MGGASRRVVSWVDGMEELRVEYWHGAERAPGPDGCHSRLDRLPKPGSPPEQRACLDASGREVPVWAPNKAAYTLPGGKAPRIAVPRDSFRASVVSMVLSETSAWVPTWMRIGDPAAALTVAYEGGKVIVRSREADGTPTTAQQYLDGEGRRVTKRDEDVVKLERFDDSGRVASIGGRSAQVRRWSGGVETRSFGKGQSRGGCRAHRLTLPHASAGDGPDVDRRARRGGAA